MSQSSNVPEVGLLRSPMPNATILSVSTAIDVTCRLDWGPNSCHPSPAGFHPSHPKAPPATTVLSGRKPTAWVARHFGPRSRNELTRPAESRTNTAPSFAPVARVDPSGENATACTTDLWSTVADSDL